MTELNESYWDTRYLENDAAWDIGYAAPALARYFDQLTDKRVSILIPGGGNSHEALYLLEQGFTDVTVADISAVVCEKLKERYAGWLDKGLKVIHADFFQLRASYDLIMEQTFFCALDPSLRNDYVVQMQQLLKPGGKLFGLLFNRDFEVSPPFGGSKAEYEERFDGHLKILIMEPCYNSIERRAGTELFFICSLK